MKKLFAPFLGLLLAAQAFGATLVPPQLLNPSGSTSGQVVMSSGPSSQPGWTALPVSSLTAGSGIAVSGTGNVTVSIAAPVSIANGGTNATSASGTALDNISGFSGTGFLTRTGAGAYAFQSLTNGITLANLAQAAANTVLANATGSTANVAAFSMPSCSTSASALNWTSGSGFTCNTAVNAAQLGGATFSAPGAIGSTTAGSGAFTTITASSTITPSQTAGIVGTTTNNSANAGSVGEYVTNNTTGTSIASGSPFNATSVSLTAGDWDVTGIVEFIPAGTTVVTGVASGISTTSGVRRSFFAESHQDFRRVQTSTH